MGFFSLVATRSKKIILTEFKSRHRYLRIAIGSAVSGTPTRLIQSAGGRVHDVACNSLTAPVG